MRLETEGLIRLEPAFANFLQERFVAHVQAVLAACLRFQLVRSQHALDGFSLDLLGHRGAQLLSSGTSPAVSSTSSNRATAERTCPKPGRRPRLLLELGQRSNSSLSSTTMRLIMFSSSRMLPGKS